MKLVVFTNNAHKLQEIRDILSGFPGDVSGYLDVFHNEIDVIEDGLTFESNARKKVEALPMLPDMYFLADDSGLEVTALDNRPGVLSARYGGDCSHQEKCTLLLKELDGKSDRSARFRCVIALRHPSGEISLYNGTVDGQIAATPRGEKGFGYDPIFIPEGYKKTFGEMTPEEKHALSHRGRALNQVASVLKEH